jgi:butyrate kinase
MPRADRMTVLPIEVPHTDLADLDLGPQGPGFILAVNPGSLSSKIGIGQAANGGLRFCETELRHDDVEGTRQRKIRLRKEIVLKFLRDSGADPKKILAICCRGGFLLPNPGGLIRLNEQHDGQWRPDARLVADLEHAEMEHPCNFGIPIALGIIETQGLAIPAFTLDPVTTDQMTTLAAYAGKKGFSRRSIFHALNLFATSRLLAEHLGKDLAETNLVACHLGGGISVVAMQHGQAADVNNALLGEPPFTPQRGTPQLGDAVDYVLYMRDRGASRDEILFREFTTTAGLRSYTGTADLTEIEARVRDGDDAAAEAVRAMAYQVVKAIGAMASAIGEPLDAILLTGGGARCALLLDSLSDCIGEGMLAAKPLFVSPGSLEQYAMVERTYRCLRGEVAASTYAPRPRPTSPRPTQRLREILDEGAALVRENPKTVALCVPNDESLVALRDARDVGIIKGALLVGDKGEIETLARGLDFGLAEYGFDIVEPPVEDRSERHRAWAQASVRLVRDGSANMLMKGLAHTGELIRAILDRDEGLSGGGRLSMSCVTYLPRHDRIIVFADPGINTETDNFDVMVEEVRGAMRLARYFRMSPKVAFLSAIERTTPRIPSTLMAARLAEHFTTEARSDAALGDAAFQGPLALDLALDPEVATEKRCAGPVAGQANVLIFPDIESANVFYKAITQAEPSRLIATAIPGTMAPCVIVSRGDSHQVRMASIALGAYLEELYQRQLRGK